MSIQKYSESSITIKTFFINVITLSITSNKSVNNILDMLKSSVSFNMLNIVNFFFSLILGVKYDKISKKI
jgi:hypothetical protein